MQAGRIDSNMHWGGKGSIMQVGRKGSNMISGVVLGRAGLGSWAFGSGLLVRTRALEL